MRYIGICFLFVLIRFRLKLYFKRLIIDCLKCYIRMSFISKKGYFGLCCRYSRNLDGIR